MFRKTLPLLIALLVIAVLSEALVPFVVSRYLKTALQRTISSQDMVVYARTFPGVSLLGGTFDTVRADATNARADKLPIREYHIVLEGARLDMSALINDKKVVVTQARNLQVFMKFNEADLAEYLNATIKNVKNVTVAITPDKIELNGSIDTGILSASIGVTGRIVADNKSIRFVSERVNIGGAGGRMLAGLLGDFVLVDLARLPFQINVRRIAYEPGHVSIFADNHF